METLKEMRFPAVTVCNMNPLRYSQVQDNYDLMSAVQVAASKWGVSLNAFEHDAFYNVSNIFMYAGYTSFRGISVLYL